MKLLARREQTRVTGRAGLHSLALPAPLTIRSQILAGAGIALFLLVSFLLTKSLLPIAAMLGLGLLVVILRSPLLSILGFMGINVFITIHHSGADIGAGGVPSALDFVLGLCLIIIIAFWIFKIRFQEWKSLSSAAAQLSLTIFFVWSVMVTLGGIIANGNPPDTALREILNLLPLLVIPILYEKYIGHGSRSENILAAWIMGSGLILVAANLLYMRSNVAHAIYLYQTGRGYMDVTLYPFIVVFLVSYLMVEERKDRRMIAIFLLLTEMAGVLVSMTRNIYVATPVVSIVIWFFGTRKERKRATKGILASIALGTIAIAWVAASSRIIAILLKAYLVRLSTTQRLGHDLSLRERFREWSDIWHAIARSPILGHGFGASFRTFDIVQQCTVLQPFSHNSFLYIIFKTGFIGATLFLIPFVTFLIKAFRLATAKNLSERSRMIARGCLGCLLALLFAADLGPVFDSKTDLMWVGLVWGCILALEKNELRLKATRPCVQ